MKKQIKKLILLIFMASMFNSNLLLATGIQNLKLYTGSLNLLRDATTALMVIVPVACGLCILYFQFQKSLADIPDQPRWSKRTKIAIISLIFGFSASGIVNLFATYFSG